MDKSENFSFRKSIDCFKSLLNRCKKTNSKKFNFLSNIFGVDESSKELKDTKETLTPVESFNLELEDFESETEESFQVN